MFKFYFVPRQKAFYGLINPNKVIQARKSFRRTMDVELLDH